MLRTRGKPISYGQSHRPIIRFMPSVYLRRAKLTTSATPELNSFQSLPIEEKNGKAEDAEFTSRVEKIKQWWSSPRFAGMKRPYSAEDVVSKQGSLQQTYPSSTMAQKLFGLLNEKAEKGLPLHTSERIALVP